MTEKSFATGIQCIVMDVKDNVVTLLRDVITNEEITFEYNGTERKLVVKEDVQFGHKLSLEKIEKGEVVIKYGESIGVATTTIEVGQHVHVHNLIGVRGRGDK